MSLLTLSIIIQLAVHSRYSRGLNSLVNAKFRKLKTSLRMTKDLTENEKVESSEDFDNIASMMKLIVAAIDEGRENDLINAGLKITKIDPKTDLDKKLNDPQVIKSILGDMNEVDELQILSDINKNYDALIHDESEEEMYSSNAIDPNILLEMREEAEGVLSKIQQSQNTFTSTILGGNLENTLSFPPGESTGVDSILASSMVLDSDIEPPYSDVVKEWPEVEEFDDDDLALGRVDDDIDGPVTSDSTSTFQQLLKATMDESEASAKDVPDDTIEKTVSAVAKGDLQQLDVRSLLGDALSTLTNELGIDMQSELAVDKGAASNLQAIVTSSMGELMQNMEELDKKSQALYEQLGNLEAALLNETQEFEEKKKYELSELLETQNLFKTEFEKSQVQVQDKALYMTNLVQEIEENADVITALALFPLKSVDKKIAFVGGLALIFKVLFDTLQLFAIRGDDFSDWFTVFTQFVLSFTLMSHYGLVRAMKNQGKEQKF